MSRAELWVPDPGIGPDAWTRQSLRLRNRAACRQECPECRAPAIRLGIDHREVHHAVVRHQPWCRCSEGSIQEHLEAHGLDMPPERYVLLVVELTGLY